MYAITIVFAFATLVSAGDSLSCPQDSRLDIKIPFGMNAFFAANVGVGWHGADGRKETSK